jgi:hypothetical protein
MRYIYENDMPLLATNSSHYDGKLLRFLRREESNHRFKPNGITDNRKKWRRKENTRRIKIIVENASESMKILAKAFGKIKMTKKDNAIIAGSFAGYNQQKSGELSEVVNKTPNLGNTDFGFN